jgi:hypothetical protein
VLNGNKLRWTGAAVRKDDTEVRTKVENPAVSEIRSTLYSG